MQLLLLAFAQARDQLGFTERCEDFQPAETPRQLLGRVAPQWQPAGIRVAVDREYRGWDEPLGPAQEVALIPPVSGG